MTISGVLFAILDDEGVPRSWNKAFESYFKISETNFTPFHSLFPGDCHQVIKQNLKSVLADNSTKSFSISSQNSGYDIRFEPLSVRLDGSRSVAVYIDLAVTAYSKFTTDILEAIIDATSDPVLLFDSKGTVLRANQLFLEVMHIPDAKENLVGKHVMEIFPPEYRDSRRTHVEYVLTQKKDLFVEVEFCGKTGKGHLMPIFGESGDVELVMVITQDITHTYTLKHKEEIINSMSSELDETTIAVKRVTKIMEQEQASLKASLLNSINTNVKPLMQKLKSTCACDGKALLLLDVAIDNLISESLRYAGSVQDVKLTLTENRVCQLIKNGYKIREIAEILNLADDTVKNHRKNIRRKLGLQNKHVNLRSYLESNAHGNLS